MKKFIYLFVLIGFALLMGGQSVQAQDFVYQAKNPAFGGDTFNYQWLQSSATAQDKLKDPDARTSSSAANRDPLEDFKESLNRQILSQLSRQLVTSQFGEGGLEPGSYTIGNYQIDVTEGTDGVVIQLLDISTGSETVITVPYY